jgi:polyphenol oxidase
VLFRSDRVVDAGALTGSIGEGDALISDHPGSLLAIRTADCVPVLIADPVRRVCAAVHAGWRGTAAGIVAKTVGEMARKFSSRPADLVAAIGPAIGKCCYEVGPEVAGEFGFTGRSHLDLPETNRRQLLESGLQPRNVDTADLCTACGADDFHSYRRDKTTGRMVSAIGIAPLLRGLGC